MHCKRFYPIMQPTVFVCPYKQSINAIHIIFIREYSIVNIYKICRLFGCTCIFMRQSEARQIEVITTFQLCWKNFK